jgi:hypothetical protein
MAARATELSLSPTARPRRRIARASILDSTCARYGQFRR